MATPVCDSAGTPLKLCQSSSLSSRGKVEHSEGSCLGATCQSTEAQAETQSKLEVDPLQQPEAPTIERAGAGEVKAHKKRVLKSDSVIDDKDELVEEAPAQSPGALEDEVVMAVAAPEPQRRMSTRQKKIIIKPPPKKTPRKTVWTTERLLSDPKSPLAKADLRSIFGNPMAWDVLDPRTRTEVLALFPHKHMVLDAGTGHARPDIGAMMNDDTFRGDCASYTQNILQGRHDPGWLTSAYHAHHKRRMGEFDEHLVQQVYDDWGVELPEDFKPRRAPVIPNAKGQESHTGEGRTNGTVKIASAEADVFLGEGQEITKS